MSGVTKASYPYQEDEFDQAALHPGPRGVHRRPRSRFSRWFPYLAILVLAPALAYGLVTYLSNSGSTANIPGLSSLTDDGGGSGTPSATTSPTATAPSVATPTATTAPTPALGTKITVLNAAGISGIAAKAVAKLTAAGFTDVTPGNYNGTALDASVVFYATPEQAVTAKAVAAALGIGPVQESATQANGAIVVVLKSDYKP